MKIKTLTIMALYILTLALVFSSIFAYASPRHVCIVNAYSNVPDISINGTGVYDCGDQAILSAPGSFEVNGTKYVLEEWVSVGSTPTIPQLVGCCYALFRVRGNHTIKAIYTRYYKVEVTYPGGYIFNGYVREGEPLRIEAPKVIEVEASRVRLVFDHWKGIEMEAPVLTIYPDRPLKIQAIYQKEYYIKVYSPFGSFGAGWYKAGSRVTIYIPEEPRSMIFIKWVLDGFSGCSECGYSKGVLTIYELKRPLVIDVTYSVVLDVQAILQALILAFLLLVLYKYEDIYTVIKKLKKQ